MTVVSVLMDVDDKITSDGSSAVTITARQRGWG